MAQSSLDSRLPVSLLSGEGVASAAAIEQDVLLLFDRLGLQLLRYAASFGISRHEAEDVVQDVFLALCRHLRLGRSRCKLQAWLFRVTHNLALKQRRRMQREPLTASLYDGLAEQRLDPGLDPEARLAHHERRRRLRAVVHALPAHDRRCLLMRAAGLTYRDIAATLGMSLGAVAKAVARATTRLINADRG